MEGLDVERFVDPFDLPERREGMLRPQTAEELDRLHMECGRTTTRHTTNGREHDVVLVRCICGLPHIVDEAGKMNRGWMHCSCGNIHGILIDDATGELRRDPDHWY